MEFRAHIQRRQDTKEKKRHKSVNLTRTPNYSQQKSFPERADILSWRVGGMRKSKENATSHLLNCVMYSRSFWERKKENERAAPTLSHFPRKGVEWGPTGPTDSISKQKAKNRLPQKFEREKNHFSFSRRGWTARKVSGFSTETCYLLSAIFEVVKRGATVGRSVSLVCARFFIDLNDHIEVSQLSELPLGDFAVFNADSALKSLWSAFKEKFSPKSQEYLFRSCRITFRIFAFFSTCSSCFAIPGTERKSWKNCLFRGVWQLWVGFFLLFTWWNIDLCSRLFPCPLHFSFSHVVGSAVLLNGMFTFFFFYLFRPFGVDRRAGTTACVGPEGLRLSRQVIGFAGAYCAIRKTAVPAVQILRGAEN